MVFNNKAMKKILMVLLLLISTHWTKAQTFSEWFDQKNTQKKYLLQQIAVLQVYIADAQKGYKIAKQGLDFIGNMKKGEFDLHNDFFNSLKNVNPSVSKDAKVKDIATIQSNILDCCNQAKKQLQSGGMLSSDELQYINGVFDRLLQDCNELLDELKTVITSGKLEMKDDERIKRIAKIHTEMQDNYTFVQNFSNEAKVMAAARSVDKNDINASRSINNIKN